MINQKNVALGEVRSVIRELFEYGKRRKAEIGEENVYDFSLGNPSVPAPKEVNEQLKKIIDETDPVLLHGYTSAQGDANVRKAIADYINERFATNLMADCLYMTCGAAASLTITLNALVNDGDEVIVFSPYFPEYRVFAEHAGAELVVCECEDLTFQIDFDKLAAALSPKTKAVIINSPNNPSGVVYGEETIQKLCDVLTEHSEKRGEPVYLISDEPYRELVFDDCVKVPYIMNYYSHSIVCYSYSKSLSLPGERIGYIAVNNQMDEFKKVYAAVCGAGRALGFVCAPNLFQQLVARLQGVTSDISVYKRNRDILCKALTEYGYTVVKPDGAFYLFVKSLEEDANAFAERAKSFELLLVAGDDFGCKGYVRISYCVSPDMITRSLPAFKKLAESYKTVKKRIRKKHHLLNETVIYRGVIMLYTIKNDYISLTVNGEGGSMTSLVYLPTGEERLWQGGEEWSSRDVVIFPIIGHAGEYKACGKTYAPRSHGVARYSVFKVADVKSDAITLSLSSDVDTLKTYPYAFDFSITYKLVDNCVQISYFVRSQGGKIPFYVGGHPGMKAPGGEALIEFENEENPVMYPINSDAAVQLSGISRFVANKAFFAECKTFQLGSLSGGNIYATTRDGYRYTYSSDCPVFAFWSNEKIGDYVCVEPWWGINDFPTAPREITLKPFINFADENGRSFTYRLTVEKK